MSEGLRVGGTRVGVALASVTLGVTAGVPAIRTVGLVMIVAAEVACATGEELGGWLEHPRKATAAKRTSTAGVITPGRIRGGGRRQFGIACFGVGRDWDEDGISILLR